MEIQQLIGFLAVAQSGSFSIAAQKTHRTQPAVSLQIRALEQEFNTRLFDRLGPQKVTLTDDGKVLFDLIEPIVKDIRQVEERFNDIRKQSDNFSLIVASHNTAIMYLLPDVVKVFKSQYPTSLLSVINRQRETILSMVRNDEAHIGITSLKIPPSWANYEVLGKFRRVLICNHDHPLLDKKRMTLEDIARYPLILPPIGGNTRSAIDDAFSKERVSYNLVLEVRGREAVKHFVEIGLGISILSEYYLPKEASQNVIMKDASNFFGYSESGLITRKGRYLSSGVKHFIAIVRKQIHEIT